MVSETFVSVIYAWDYVTSFIFWTSFLFGQYLFISRLVLARCLSKISFWLSLFLIGQIDSMKTKIFFISSQLKLSDIHWRKYPRWICLLARNTIILLTIFLLPKTIYLTCLYFISGIIFSWNFNNITGGKLMKSYSNLKVVFVIVVIESSWTCRDSQA